MDEGVRFMGCSGTKAWSQNCLDSRRHGRVGAEACFAGAQSREDGSSIQRVGQFA